MKMFWKSKLGATLVLFIAGIFGGLAGVFAKFILRELPPLTSLFFRILFMFLFLMIFISKSFHELKNNWKKLTVIGLLWTTNVSLFILGIGHTSVLISQVIYGLVPILVLTGNFILSKEKPTFLQLTGVTLGFTGILVFMYTPEKIAMGSGTFYGNLLITIATFSWAGYLLISKKQSSASSPLTLTTASAIVGLPIVAMLSHLTEGPGNFRSILNLSPTGWFMLFNLAIIISVLMVYFIQWGVKYASAFASAAMMYVSVFVSGIAGAIIFGDKFTLQTGIGTVLLLSGVFVAITLPIIRKR